MSTPSEPAARPSGRLFLDLTVGLGGLGYILLVLIGNLESPLLSLAVVALIAYQLLQPRLGKRH